MPGCKKSRVFITCMYRDPGACLPQLCAFKMIDMKTRSNILRTYGNQEVASFSETGRSLAWQLPAAALDMPWQSNPLQNSGRTVPELCQNSGMFTDCRFGRSGQDALLSIVQDYTPLKILVDQLFPFMRNDWWTGQIRNRGCVTCKPFATIIFSKTQSAPAPKSYIQRVDIASSLVF